MLCRFNNNNNKIKISIYINNNFNNSNNSSSKCLILQEAIDNTYTLLHNNNNKCKLNKNQIKLIQEILIIQEEHWEVAT
jgi:hypothetical protein